MKSGDCDLLSLQVGNQFSNTLLALLVIEAMALMVSGCDLSRKNQCLCVSIARGTDSILESPGSAMVDFPRCCVSVGVEERWGLGESTAYKSCLEPRAWAEESPV